MVQHHDLGRTQDDLSQEQYNFLQEREKFLNTLESINTTSEERLIILRELEKVMDEVAFTRAALRSLRVKMNRSSRKMGLQSVPRNGKNGNSRPEGPD